MASSKTEPNFFLSSFSFFHPPDGRNPVSVGTMVNCASNVLFIHEYEYVSNKLISQNLGTMNSVCQIVTSAKRYEQNK